MLKKETFVKVINQLIEQRQLTEKFTEAIDVMFDGYPVFVGDEKPVNALLMVLNEIFDDKDDFIGWWLYEDVEKEIWYEYGSKITLKTAEDLYDFLIKEKKNKN